MTDSFKKIEGLFEQLLGTLSSVFSEDQIKEVCEFIDVGEYGLALETAIDIFIEEEKDVPDSSRPVIDKLIVIMQLEPTKIAEKWAAL